MQNSERTDKRVKIMSEILSGIQAIKMYAWEKSFAKLVAHIRKYDNTRNFRLIFFHFKLGLDLQEGNEYHSLDILHSSNNFFDEVFTENCAISELVCIYFFW